MMLVLRIMAGDRNCSNRLTSTYSAEEFDKDIPSLIANGENISRLLVFVLPILMPIRIETESQKLGLWLYVIGVAIYFVSWLVQMALPQSAWSLSAFGFLAPAYTPLIWLVGIGLIGKELYFDSPYRSWIYILLSVIFIGLHLSHAWTVYSRN